MTLRQRLEYVALWVALALPARVQRLLAGRPIVRDGQTLAVDTQLMLRLQQVTRMPGVGDLPIPEGRALTAHQTTIAARRQPIGAVGALRVAGLPARLYHPTTPAPTKPLLVFFHGGGFFFGGLDSHDGACRFLAERSGVPVLAIDYRLAPEAPFPAAYDDALAAYRWVVEHADELGADPARLAVGGDSAGGNLAAAVAIEAARTGLPLALQLLVYPVTDADRSTASAAMFNQGFYLTQSFLDLAHDTYIGTNDLHDPRISPAYAELPAGLAPAYVVTAGFDPLRDEGEAYARRLADAGVPVELRRFPDQIHGFFNVVGVGRTSRAANAEIAVKLRAGLV